MKQITLLIFMLILSISINAQIDTTDYEDNNLYTEVASSSKIDLNTYSQTVKIANVDFIGGYSKSGSIWIKKLSSKSGKYYKQYLGTPTNDIYKNNVVWTTKKQDKFWYFTASKTDEGNYTLKRTYLKLNLE